MQKTASTTQTTSSHRDAEQRAAMLLPATFSPLRRGDDVSRQMQREREEADTLMGRAVSRGDTRWMRMKMIPLKARQQRGQLNETRKRANLPLVSATTPT